jgi:hypothetical protein
MAEGKRGVPITSQPYEKDLIFNKIEIKMFCPKLVRGL